MASPSLQQLALVLVLVLALLLALLPALASLLEQLLPQHHAYMRLKLVSQIPSIKDRHKDSIIPIRAYSTSEHIDLNLGGHRFSYYWNPEQLHLHEHRVTKYR